MAKTRDIRHRIRSIRNTMQLTRAMKMVSAAKLRRAHDRIVRARPYAARMRDVLRSLASRANPEAHPLLEVRGDRRAELVVVSADKGLCGSFNTNIFKTATAFLESRAREDLTVHTVGKKGRDYFRRRHYQVTRQWVDVFRQLDYPLAAEIGRDLMDRYVNEELDAIYVVYNEFKSAIQQRPVIEQLLPVERMELQAGEVAEDYIYEPTPEGLFAAILPQYVVVQLYRALLESAAAEHAARMTAMDSATNNAKDLIESLTLYMNRLRQSSITTELIEVVSGAEALG